MTPTFTDFFKSYYYSETYVSAVDLSDEAISQHLLEKENPEVASKAQSLISTAVVQKILSEPLSYDLMGTVPLNNEILTKLGFKLLSSKPNAMTGELVPFYSVIEHDDLPGWIIKSGASRIPSSQILLGPLNDRNEMAIFTKEESILRIEMAKRVQKAANAAKIDVIVPKKKLITYKNVDAKASPNRKYCVICEKIDVLSFKETVETIKSMDAEKQREVAKKISTIVQKAGLVDATFHNIRLTPSGKLAFIDTEPAGLMVRKGRSSSKRGSCVEKCARIGLFNLMHQTSKATLGTQTSLIDRLQCEPGLEPFRDAVNKDYERIQHPKLSKWKITFSILSLGIIPLINAISALVKTMQTKRVHKKLRAMDSSFQKKNIKSKPQSEQIRLIQEFQKRRTRIAKKFFSHIEGVPYIA